MTAPPAKLVAMCYQRTIGAQNAAIRAIESGNIQVRCDNATRAANIIFHLWSTLDMEKGGEITQNLSNIYSFAMQRLVDANLKNDARAARDVIDLMKPLHQSWEELADSGEAMPSRMPSTSAAMPPRAMPKPSPQTRPRSPAAGPYNEGGGLTISV
jgi:flagellar protein FliS